jgi:hypothetical protein
VNAFSTGLVAGYGIAIPVGAIAVLIVAKAALESFRSAAVAGLMPQAPTSPMPQSLLGAVPRSRPTSVARAPSFIS